MGRYERLAVGAFDTMKPSANSTAVSHSPGLNSNGGSSEGGLGLELSAELYAAALGCETPRSKIVGCVSPKRG